MYSPLYLITFSLLKEGVVLNLPMLCFKPDCLYAWWATKKIMCVQGGVAESYGKDGGAVFIGGKPERFMFESALQRVWKPSPQPYS